MANSVAKSHFDRLGFLRDRASCLPPKRLADTTTRMPQRGTVTNHAGPRPQASRCFSVFRLFERFTPRCSPRHEASFSASLSRVVSPLSIKAQGRRTSTRPNEEAWPFSSGVSHLDPPIVRRAESKERRCSDYHLASASAGNGSSRSLEQHGDVVRVAGRRSARTSRQGSASRKNRARTIGEGHSGLVTDHSGGTRPRQGRSISRRSVGVRTVFTNGTVSRARADSFSTGNCSPS